MQTRFNASLCRAVVLLGISMFLCATVPGQASGGTNLATNATQETPSLQLSSFEPHQAAIGDLLTLTFSNVPGGSFKSLQDTNKAVLLLGEIALRNICCGFLVSNASTVRMQFNLAFGTNNRAQWSEIIARQRAGESIPVGLATSDGTEYPCSGDDPFLSLTVMRPSQQFLAGALLLLFLYVFLYLATQTEMLRDSDPSLPPSLAARAKKPEKSTSLKNSPLLVCLYLAVTVGAVLLVIWLDKKATPINAERLSQLFAVAVLVSVIIHFWVYWKPAAAKAAAKALNPYSLARTQMAVWFFLAVCSWVFLWLVTGTLNTLTATVLALMGIGAATALGAEVQDAGKPTYPETIDSKIKALEDKQKKGTAVPSDLVDLHNLQVELNTELAKDAPTSDGFFTDVLTDASSGISFHRFQMFIWTIVLAIVFAVQVCQQLVMPDFDNTMLALMGISSGTYLGFMLKEPHSSQEAN